MKLLFVSLALLVSPACHTTPTAGTGPSFDAGGALDEARRESLLSAVTALAGRWEAPGEDGQPQTHVFTVGSHGTAVREIMFHGAPHEMTNMYTLDGNSLALTHYCALGNQPRMRASALDGDQLVFSSTGVGDHKSPDEVYMGELTLTFVDDDTVEQHWRAFKGGEVDHERVIRLKRIARVQ